MKKWKWIITGAMAVALCASMTACMNNASQPETTQSPNFMPETTAAPATQQPVAFDWVTGSGTVESAVNRISEISDSRVVVAGSTALVGVKFTAAYQGEVTERIREMVAAEVKKADPEIQTVAVTAEEEDVQKVYDISERLRSGVQDDAIKNEINEIVRNATTLR